MDLDLRKLRYFLAVAEDLSFTRAARRPHITQPVLSRQIRALETQLSVQLFVRDSAAVLASSSQSRSQWRWRCRRNRC